MTSKMMYIFALGVGFKCPRKIHLNTQCPKSLMDVPLQEFRPAIKKSLRILTRHCKILLFKSEPGVIYNHVTYLGIVRAFVLF